MANNSKIHVSDEDVERAFVNFVSMFHPGKVGCGYYFWGFTGAIKRDTDTKGWLISPPEAVVKIKALAGPHYKSVAKAMMLNGADPFKEGR